jgi:predicted MPP superfamily phosphohydrolase
MFKFIFAYILIYTGVHAAFFQRARVLLPAKWWAAPVFILFLIIMIFSPLLSRILELKGSDFFARIVAFAGYFWMGFIFLAFIGCIFIYLFNLTTWISGAFNLFRLPMLTGKISTLAIIVVSVLLIIYGYLEAIDIKVEHIAVETEKLPKNANPLRIAQISDVHLGIINRSRFLKKLMGKIIKESPDMLVCTGDLVDGSMTNLMHLADLIKGFKPVFGKYAVTGNHEYYAGLEHSIAFMKSADFTVLRQEIHTIGNLINIAGVDDGGRIKQIDAEETLSKVQNNLFTLYLKHRPDISKETMGKYDLQLSGHTHNGQIFPFNYLVELEFPLMKGIHELEKNSRIYINRGSGTWGPPVRILSPPEITIITLKSK